MTPLSQPGAAAGARERWCATLESGARPLRRACKGGTCTSNPIGLFEIIGKDALALHKFYAEVFGWKISPPAAEMGNYSLIDMEAVGIGGGLGAGDPSVAVYIEVDDLQSYLDRAAKTGEQVQMPVAPIKEGVTIAMFGDPAGNMMGILEATPRRAGAPRGGSLPTRAGVA